MKILIENKYWVSLSISVAATVLATIALVAIQSVSDCIDGNNLGETFVALMFLLAMGMGFFGLVASIVTGAMESTPKLLLALASPFILTFAWCFVSCFGIAATGGDTEQCESSYSVSPNGTSTRVEHVSSNTGRDLPSDSRKWKDLSDSEKSEACYDASYKLHTPRGTYTHYLVAQNCLVCMQHAGPDAASVFSGKDAAESCVRLIIVQF